MEGITSITTLLYILLLSLEMGMFVCSSYKMVLKQMQLILLIGLPLKWQHLLVNMNKLPS